MFYHLRNFIHVFLLICCIAAAETVSAQEPGDVNQLQTSYVDDSLYFRSPANAAGNYHYSIPITAKAGSRLYIYFMPYGANQRLATVDFSDTLNARYVKYTYDNNGRKNYGTIEIDTVFAKDTKFSLCYTTTQPKAVVRFKAMAFMAQPGALKLNESANFCDKVYYLIQHAQNGYRFIRGSKQSDEFGFQFYRPAISLGADSAMIEKRIGLLEYQSSLGSGSREDADRYFKEVEAGMRQCLGSEFTYTATTANNLPKLVCQRIQPVTGIVIHNREYDSLKSKNPQPRQIITVSMSEVTVGENKLYEITFTLRDAFYQF